MEADDRIVNVDYRALSADALRGLIEEFVSREGTDYGARERTFEDKVRDVVRQIEAGKARIVYDLLEDRVNIVPVRPLP